MSRDDTALVPAAARLVRSAPALAQARAPRRPLPGPARDALARDPDRRPAARDDDARQRAPRHRARSRVRGRVGLGVLRDGSLLRAERVLDRLDPVALGGRRTTARA